MQKSWVNILLPAKFVFFLDLFLLAVSGLGVLTRDTNHWIPNGLGDLVQAIALITTVGLTMSAHRFLRSLGWNFYSVLFFDLLIFVALGFVAVVLAFLVAWDGW